MRKILFFACTVALLWASALGRPAFAIVSLVGAVPSTTAVAVSGLSAVGVGSAVTVATPNSWWGGAFGYALTLGGIVVVAVDPPAGTFYDGQFTLHYDSNHLQVKVSGWLGDWGADPALPPPPADPDDYFTGLTFVIQDDTAAGLSAVIADDAVNGLQSVSFDWGLSGHAAGSSEPFNFFATAFEAKQDLMITYVGSGATPPADANLYVTTSGLHCSLPGSDLIEMCGESTTSYFKTTPATPVPEPATYALMLAGFGLLGLATRRKPS